MPITRRTLLKTLLATGAYGLLPTPGLSGLVFAADNAAPKPILLVVHLRGGCDGLNLISPASDPDFVDARASDLRVGTDGADAGYSLANGPDAKIDFRLHHAAGGLAELYQSGQLAFIHAAGLTNATRSHFVATDMIEHGVAGETDLARVESGWLARALNADAAASIPAIAASNSIAGDLAALDNVMAVPDFGGGLGAPGGAKVASVLQQLYGSATGEAAAAGRTALQLMAEVDGRLPRDAQGKVLPYQAQNGAAYDPAADFARPLKVVAQLIRMELGLEAATVDLGSWDTHEGQQGRFRNLTERLSNGLTAFWNDMSAYHDRLVIVTVTEFGRRLRGNKSGGTDHGRAGLMAVLGGNVKGGRFHGGWPGLRSEHLDEGVDLAVATDYRQVLTEILTHREGGAERGGGPANRWFPNYKYPGALGLFA